MIPITTSSLPFQPPKISGLVQRENLIRGPLFIYRSFITPEDQQYRTSLADRSKFALHQALHMIDHTRWSRSFHPIE